MMLDSIELVYGGLTELSHGDIGSVGPFAG